MATAKNTFTRLTEVRRQREGTGLQSGSGSRLNQMHFETTEHDCELFLAAEGVGFLMLSADGEMLRKWQGLTIGDASICAGIRWEFAHTPSTRPLLRRNWKATQRDSVSITRHWRADCGCELTERWDWSSPSIGLMATLSVNKQESHSCVQDEVHLRAIPLWTLARAGDFHCGTQSTRLLHNPREPQTLHLSTEESAAQIDVSCSLQMYPGQLSEPGEWQTLPTAAREWLPTPKDAQRGEQSGREILTSHFFPIRTQKDGAAQVIFSQPRASSPAHRASASSRRITPTSAFTCAHEKLSTAFHNSAESLNQLVQTRSDGTLGLQAGLPWFTQFWTRDMCHSFRAAFLWSGRTATGEALVSNLWLSSRRGSIPNYTTTQTTTNNSIDAPPLLLLSTADLAEHCGWSAALEKSRPLIKQRLLEACEIFASGGLILHGPADTWMDAQKSSPHGENIPCSPRANRAFEIQAFWVAALHRWGMIFEKLDDQKTSETLLQAAQTGLKTVRSLYLHSDGTRWADTLHPNGSADFSIRPNVLLGFSALHRAGCLDTLLTADELKSCVEVMLQSDLIVPYGVRTLSPETSVTHTLPINELFEDESPYIHEGKIHFHPYHEFGSRMRLEHPDWAYHNGTIWPWLSASASEILLLTGHTKMAEKLYETLVYHATQGAQGGALPELLDGLSSHSNWSWPKGAPHQAWSEAAFVHMILEAWIGLRLTSFGEKLLLDSSLWNNFPDFDLAFDVRDGRVTLRKSKGTAELSFLASRPGATLIVCEKSRHGSITRESQQTLSANESIFLKLWIS